MGKILVSHESPEFQELWNRQTKKRIRNKHNGGYYYSKEIVENIIPLIKTSRPWVTVNLRKQQICDNHAIVFVHMNWHPEWYNWMEKYDDLIFVCSKEKTCEAISHLGKTIYLPLSVDVEEIKKYKRPKDRKTAFAGRKAKRYGIHGINLPSGIDYIENVSRDIFLSEMARYKNIYAVDRVAIEAKILDCNILPYDPDFPDPDVWKILDNKDAAVMLQEKLDEIDR